MGRIMYPEDKITGNWESKEVRINGNILSPERSQKVCNHSPDGFNWSYGGSGPAQLALAIMIQMAGEGVAERAYQDFKWDVISKLPEADFELTVGEVWDWMKAYRGT